MELRRLRWGALVAFLFCCYRWTRRNRNEISSLAQFVNTLARLISPPRKRTQAGRLTTDPWAGASTRIAARSSTPLQDASSSTPPQLTHCNWCLVPRDEAEGAEWKDRWFCNKCNEKWETKKSLKKLRLVRYSLEPALPQDGEFYWLPNFVPPDEAQYFFDQIASELALTGNGSVDWSCHQKCEVPEQSEAFRKLIHRLTEHFCVKLCEARLNYFRNGEDWKPFHHDSHMFHTGTNLQEDFTICISLGDTRDFALFDPVSRAEIALESHSGDVVAFDSRFNQVLQHGVLPGSGNKGRISICVWCNRRANERYPIALAEHEAKLRQRNSSLKNDVQAREVGSSDVDASTEMRGENKAVAPTEAIAAVGLAAVKAIALKANEAVEVVTPTTAETSAEVSEVVTPTAAEVAEVSEVMTPTAEDDALAKVSEVVTPTASEAVAEVSEVVTPTAAEAVAEVSEVVTPAAVDAETKEVTTAKGISLDTLRSAQDAAKVGITETACQLEDSGTSGKKKKSKKRR